MAGKSKFNEQIAYVYQHICIATNEIFYIGIGTRKNFGRAYEKYTYRRNSIWHNYVNKYGPFSVEILNENITRANAVKIEAELINKYGRLCDNTGKLTNLLLSEEYSFYGMIRKPHTAETKEKLRLINTGKKLSDDTKNKMSKVRIGKKFSTEARINIKNGVTKSIGRKILCNDIIYDCINDAAKILNVKAENICKVCKGKRLHTKGYKFKYID